MKDNQGVIENIDELEAVMQSQINAVFSEVVKNINEALGKVLNSTITDAEIMEISLASNINRIKTFICNSSNIVREKQFKKKDWSENTNYKGNPEMTNMACGINSVMLNVKIEDSDDANSLLHVNDTTNTTNALVRQYPKNTSHQNTLSNNLKLQINSSENAQNLECPQCDYITTIKHNLTRHVRHVHEKVKNYTCHYCEYKSFQKGHLARHMDAMHQLNIVKRFNS